MLDAGKVLQRALEVFQKDPLVLIVGGIIVSVLSGVTLGILGGPLLASFYLMIMRRIREDKAPDYGDVFSELSQLGRWIGPFYVLAILLFIGFLFLIVPGVIMFTFWMFVFPIMLDNKNISLGDAMKESHRIVKERGLMQHLAITGAVVGIHLVVGGVFNFIGGPFISSLGNGVALAFTYPVIVCAYLQNMEAQTAAIPVEQETGGF